MFLLLGLLEKGKHLRQSILEGSGNIDVNEPKTIDYIRFYKKTIK